MATKPILLSAIATFGFALLAIGELREPSGGDVPRTGRVAATSEAPRLEIRQAPATTPFVPAAVEPPVASVEILPEDRTAPTDVWATPAEWSMDE